MQAMNAVDALNPALKRWRELVWDKFRVGRLLKLGFVALLAEASGGSGSFSPSFPSGHNHPGSWGQMPPMWRASLMTMLVGVAIVFFIVGIVVFYLSCRMKFAEFYIVATGDTRVGPPWRRYGRQTWQLFWVTIGIWAVSFLGLLVFATPFLIMFWRHGGSLVHMSPGRILGLVLVAVPVLLCWFLIFALILVVVRDLMLPAWALEGATVKQAWQWAKAVMESSPKEFAFYVLVKVGVRIAATFAGIMALMLSLLVTAIPVVLAGLGVWMGLRNAGPAGHAVMIAVAIVGAIAVFIWVMLLDIAFLGSAMLVLQCYAAYWVGSRYKPLGDLLEPPPAAPVMPVPEPPVMPSGGGGLLPPEDWTPVLG